MSIEKTLKKEIAEVDRVLAGLGPQGKAFCDQLAASKMDIAPVPVKSMHMAMYDLANNVFYCPPRAPLTVRFNFRVHEGAHAVQAQELPAFIERLTAPVQLTPDALVKFRRAAEQNAHAVQGYFDALAVNKTGNMAFIEDINLDTVLETYMCTLRNLVSDGRKPLAVGQTIARTFLNFMVKVGVPGDELGQTLDIRQSALLDMLSLVQYDALIDSDNLAGTRVDITRAELKSFLNAVIVTDPHETVLNKLDSPLILSVRNRKIYKELQAKLAALTPGRPQ